MGVPIQDRSDQKARLVMRGSTRGWSYRNKNTPMISFYIPEDFNSEIYYIRRQEIIDSFLFKMQSSEDLVFLYESLLRETEFIRDYLWVADEEAVILGSKALEVLPNNIVVNCVRWAITDFWNRQAGWPDLLVYNNSEFRFSEVKSPHDELSQDQMNWFEWASAEGDIPCELIKVKKLKEK